MGKVIDWKMMWKEISIFALVSSSISKPQFFPNYGHIEMSPRAPPPFLAPLEMSMSLTRGDYGTGSDGNLMERHLSCTYTCNVWPFQSCKMETFWPTGQFKERSECISPYWQNPPPLDFNGQKMKYSNYPSCASVPNGCNRCDDECARREGKRGKDDY